MDDCRAASLQFWKTDAACRCPPFSCPVRLNAHEVTMSPFDNIIRAHLVLRECVWRDTSHRTTRKKKDGRITDVSHDHAASGASSFCTHDWPIPQDPHSFVYQMSVAPVGKSSYNSITEMERGNLSKSTRAASQHSSRRKCQCCELDCS